MNHRYLSVAIIVAALAGCAKDPVPVGSRAGTPITVLPSLPMPEAGDVVRSTRSSFIGPFTELRVEVFGVEEMQRDIMTDGDGNFSFPLAGMIAAAGLELLEEETEPYFNCAVSRFTSR